MIHTVYFNLQCYSTSTANTSNTTAMGYTKNIQQLGKVKKNEVPYREMRFRHFASVEFNGNLYMTPQDFLESLTEESPRARIGRTRLSQSEVDSMLRSTPSLSRGSEKLFRKLHDKEPHSGFRIAFNMFDLDGNQIVDKEEFLV
ncbi:unnamed protein product, partial [Candidula unifasciata]